MLIVFWIWFKANTYYIIMLQNYALIHRFLGIAPPIFNIWPCNNISPIQDCLFIDSKPHPKHELSLIESQNLLETNHMNQSIHLANQE
jgi:hypothetical protein